MPNATWITPERTAVLKQVMSNYDTDWQRAMTEHPDWVKVLQFDTKLGKKNCYNTISRYRERQTLAPTRSAAALLAKPRATPTGPRGASFWTPERDEIVSRLVQDFNADYEAAFAAHPEWRQELQYDDPDRKARLYARVSAARRGTMKRFTEPTEPAPITGQDQLLHRIVAEYVAPDGKLSLRRAFADHPDWKQELKAHSVEQVRKIYSRITVIRRKQASADRRAAAVASVNGSTDPLATGASVIVAAPQAPDVGELMHQCPQCGFDLLTFRRAFKTAFNTAFNIAKRKAQ